MKNILEDHNAVQGEAKVKEKTVAMKVKKRRKKKH